MPVNVCSSLLSCLQCRAVSVCVGLVEALTIREAVRRWCRRVVPSRRVGVGASVVHVVTLGRWCRRVSVRRCRCRRVACAGLRPRVRVALVSVPARPSVRPRVRSYPSTRPCVPTHPYARATLGKAVLPSLSVVNVVYNRKITPPFPRE
jgi:hypothetical protein